MTTTDTLKLYAALHEDVPETRPTRETDAICRKWKLDLEYEPRWVNHVCTAKMGDPMSIIPSGSEEVDVDAAIALCRCAALEWACKNSDDPSIGMMLIAWMFSGKEKHDDLLIGMCRAIHAAKGGG